MGPAIAVIALALAATGLLWLRRRLLVVTVDGPSMEPTYHQGDRVVVRRRHAAQLRLGDVVVIERPDDDGTWPAHSLPQRWLVKRVAALPGGKVPADLAPALAEQAGVDVPPGSLVLLGDNAANSYDSRYIGYFPADRLLGVVRRRMSPTAA
ncbi:S26 family signal peptidase [Rhizocola hellebori]|uniref:S26 family signal peptidase n=1 Tax=Rhizocola hellebori TaxID=1392758 RepID=A0A8J3VDV7_9ACTN|nr:S26 family signal peptidase [Rhizocola hellebori]GIH02771.1 S26 family signal peptidase [Rhizocola hellebori]